MPRADAEPGWGCSPLRLQRDVLDRRVGMAAAWPGRGRESCEVAVASSRKVHLEQTDDSSAAGARGRAGPSVNMGELRVPWGGRAGVGASGAPGSMGGWVLSPTRGLTLGTSATGCGEESKRWLCVKCAELLESERLCQFCHNFHFNPTNLGSNHTLATFPRFISGNSSESLLFYPFLSISS